MSNGDALLRSYAILSGLKQNLPEGYEVEERWVREFHVAVDGIEKTTGLNLAEFKVAQTELYRSVATSNYLTDEVTYRDGLWCQRAVLMQKIDSLLFYFSGLQSGESRRIGFSTNKPR